MSLRRLWRPSIKLVLQSRNEERKEGTSCVGTMKTKDESIHKYTVLKVFVDQDSLEPDYV